MVEVGKGNSILRPAREDCRTHATADVVARTQYAYVSYRQNHYPRARISPVPENVTLKAGDPVYVSQWSCTLNALDPNAPAREVLVLLWCRSEREQK